MICVAVGRFQIGYRLIAGIAECRESVGVCSCIGVYIVRDTPRELLRLWF
ncbi:MAG: hypothetical protein Q4C72_02670 [Eubacteriales bacterium]|nr:hypothetical protein [Eubacteriales bacterium]